MNADGSAARGVTSDAHDSEPVWSSDGALIAFTRYVNHGENYSVYAINGDGTTLRRLTKGPYDVSPAWQPGP
jgi:Tol biopolymer transport system component